jgi:capsular polysaccharide biosynthesis protein
MALLDMAGLECRPVVGVPGPGRRADEVAIGGVPQPIVHVPDLLYVPQLALQLVGDTLVPLESFQLQWSFDYRIAGQTGLLDIGEVVDVDEDVCILANGWSTNFSHWVAEELPKVVVMEAAGFTGSYVLPVAGPDATGPDPFVVESMQLLRIAADRLRFLPHGPTRYRSAAFTLPIHLGSAGARREVYLRLRALLREGAGAVDAGGSRRTWMDRGRGVPDDGLLGRKHVVNEAELDLVLDRFGVERVDMAALTLAEQVRVAAATDVLSGPHGAGFIHSLLLPKGSVVVECFTPELLNPQMAGLHRLLGHRYHVCVAPSAHGQYPWGYDLKVDLDQLCLVLETLDWRLRR